MRLSVLPLLLGIVLVAGGVAAAHDDPYDHDHDDYARTGAYLGGGFTGAINTMPNRDAFKDSVGVDGRVGYRFHPSWAVEIAYWHLGEFKMHAGTGPVTFDADLRAKSIGASIVGILPLDRFDLYGRVGYARSELKATGALGPFSSTVRERENEWFAGVGGR